jgi:hypothetical protein
VLEKRFGSKSTTANWAQVKAQIRRWNFDENLINLLILVLMLILMLLWLINPWIFIIVVEICEKKAMRTIQLAPLIAVNYGGSLIFLTAEQLWHCRWHGEDN